MPLPRLGLCCIFREQPIKFRTATATALQRLPPPDRLTKLTALCQANAQALLASLQYCSAQGIGSFRINSQILPLKTHRAVGYRLEDLPAGPDIIRQFQQCGEYAQRQGIRTCFHPDQFVVLNSPRAEVVASSIAELEYQAEVAGWVAADVINIHGGGAYGDKRKALADFQRNLDRLSPAVRDRLTVENDDKLFTPSDLLPICESGGLPLVYDVHHHRCLPDGLSVDEATTRAAASWNREPLFHISSPIEGWSGPAPSRHHDFIDPADFPDCWLNAEFTVEVEAKAKELAVLRLKQQLEQRLLGTSPVVRRSRA
jgi:UV DNA damage endonuclease